MYAEALAQRRIFCSEKMVLKLGLVLMALAVFSGQGMPIAEYGTGGVLEGYVQRNIMVKEQSDDALFLLKKKWKNELRHKYGNNVKFLSDGVAYVPVIRYINGRKTKINIAEINRNINPDIEIAPQLSSYKMHSKSKIWNIAGENSFIAVNGTYFKQDTGTPLGALVIDGEIISGPIYERAGLGISKDGFKTARISFEGELKGKNKTIKLHNINQPRMMASNVLVYTPKWGNKTPVTSKPSVHIAIRNNKIIEKSGQNVAIPYDGIAISGPVSVLNDFNLGEEVKINYSLTPNWENVDNIISGGPYLLKEGSVYIDTVDEHLTPITGKNPRTAVGYTKDNVMILITVDGRKEGSSGVTLTELAKLMQDLGCYEAINLDGGSSTVMYEGGRIHSGSNITNSVAISNALVVRNRV